MHASKKARLYLRRGGVAYSLSYNTETVKALQTIS